MSAELPEPVEAGAAEPPDVVVVEEVLSGRAEAFESLMRRYNQRVFRTARAIAPSDAEAQDAAQQAWIAAYRHLHTWERRGRLSTWLLRITVREAVRIRKSSARDHLRLVDEPMVMNEHPSPEAQAARTHLRAILERAIDSLPDGMRVVVMLRDVEELSGPEAAAVLGLSESAVRVRLHRARRLLRARLEDVLAEQVGEAYPFLGARCDAIVAEVLAAIDA